MVIAIVALMAQAIEARTLKIVNTTPDIPIYIKQIGIRGKDLFDNNTTLSEQNMGSITPTGSLRRKNRNDSFTWENVTNNPFTLQFKYIQYLNNGMQDKWSAPFTVPADKTGKNVVIMLGINNQFQIVAKQQ